MTAPEPVSPWEVLYGERAYVEAAFRTCERIQRKRGVGFYLGTRLLRQPYRDAVFALYAFAAMVDDAVDEPPGKPPEEAALALDRVDCALTEAFEGIGRSDVLVALAEVAERHRLSIDPFRRLIQGMRSDLTVRRYPRWADLEAYCELVATTIAEMIMELFGVTDPDARAAARSLAMALQLTNVVRDVADDLDRDRIYLPLEDLARFGVEERDLFARRMTPALRRLVAFEVERTRTYYAEASRLLPRLPVGRLATAWVAEAYEAILDALEARDLDLFAGRISLPLPSKLALVRSARHRLRRSTEAERRSATRSLG